MKNHSAIMFFPLIIFFLGCKGINNTTDLKAGKWELARNSDSTKYYHAIYFADQLNGWIVGDSGRVIHTSNAGVSWETQSTGTTVSLRSVQFISKQIGWVCGMAAIGTTNDGGRSWSWQYQPGDSLRGFLCLYFVNQSLGWIGDNFGGIFHTEDGGTTWFSQTSGTNWAITSIQFFDAQEGWAIATNAVVLHTTNGGKNWTATLLDTLHCGNSPVGVFQDIFFCNRTTGWIATDVSMSNTAYSLATVVHTSNAGNTWTCQSTPDIGITSIQFVDENLGWAASTQGVLCTTDGGSNWRCEFELPYFRLVDLSFVDQSHGWALSYKGEVYKYIRL